MVGGFLGYSGFFHHNNWSPWYSWNIAESGVKTPKIKSNQINQPAKKLYIYRVVLNDRESDNMSLVPWNFDSEFIQKMNWQYGYLVNI